MCKVLSGAKSNLGSSSGKQFPALEGSVVGGELTHWGSRLNFPANRARVTAADSWVTEKWSLLLCIKTANKAHLLFTFQLLF